MNAPKSVGDVVLTRFSPRQRFEHFAVMITFTMLVITGMPQKFVDQGFSHTVVMLFGGIRNAQIIHRVCGFIFAGLTIAHLAFAIWDTVTRKVRFFSIVPEKKDFFDAVQTLKYYLGLSSQQAKFDRYDYRQKFEYWGMVAGSLIMIFTGLMLFFPSLIAAFLPGQLIPAAKVMHSYEGLMAFLVVIVWHVYNAHLNPDVFPFDFSIFNGKISRHRMEHEHPLELERIEGGKPAPQAPVTPAYLKETGQTAPQ